MDIPSDWEKISRSAYLAGKMAYVDSLEQDPYCNPHFIRYAESFDRIACWELLDQYILGWQEEYWHAKKFGHKINQKIINWANFA